MLLDTLHDNKAQIDALARKYGASRVRVFGSVARGQDRPDSDVDILVDFAPGYDLFTQRLPLTEDLSELMGRRVDLIPEHELNQHIRSQVLNEAVDL